MEDMKPTEPTASTLWLADRSRYQRAVAQCDYARYLEYHSGPVGYGIRAKAETVYLPTGIFTHKIIEGALKLSQALGWKPLLPDHRADVRRIVQAAIERYYRLIDARGLRSVEGAEETLTVMEEQATLIEGLGWAWLRVLHPYLVEHFAPVAIEEEETYVLGCTCGLPDGVGELEDHETRGCEGTGWMSRADMILRRLADDELGWHELKTGSNVHKKDWDEGWEHNVQFASGLLGAERRLGQKLGHYYVHGLSKGTRRSGYDKSTGKYEGPRRQDSILCYAWMKPADPPTLPADDWQASYEWEEYDELTGVTRKRRLGKGYDKYPIWKAQFEAKPPEWSNVEYWTEWIGLEKLGNLVKLTPPYPRPTMLLEEWLLEAAANERSWRARVWNVFDARNSAAARMVAEGSKVTPELVDFQLEVRQALRENFPRNWDGCKGYYGDDCEFLPICLREPGWDDPLGSGKYIQRKPHHEPEIAQMTARGIPVPEDEDALDYQEE